MLGWLIVVRIADESKAAPQTEDDPAVLARWAVGLGGTEWLNNLVAAGKATQTLLGGYPNQFVALAGDVLPLLQSGPPAYEQVPRGKGTESSAGWIGRVQMNQQRMAACAPDLRLTVDAWDQS